MDIDGVHGSVITSGPRARIKSRSPECYFWDDLGVGQGDLIAVQWAALESVAVGRQAGSGRPRTCSGRQSLLPPRQPFLPAARGIKCTIPEKRDQAAFEQR